MADIWGTDGGVYFGFGSNRTEGPPPELSAKNAIRYVGDRHLVTVGPNGSGKSRRLLLPNLAELTGWSVLVVDPKGELAYMTGAHRAARGNKIIRLNPFDALKLGSDGFNPIAALDTKSDDFPDDAMGLAEALIRVEGKEPHWSQSAQDLICALIMYVRLVLPDATLGDVRYLLGQNAKDFRKTVLGQDIEIRGKVVPGMVAAGIIHDCEELEAKASRFGDIAPDNRELTSIMSVALTQTRWLDSRPVKKDLAKQTFDFSQMKNEPTTVYLILPARRLGTHSTWLRLMITSILQPLMRDTKKSKVPVLLMLDEFAQLGHLPVIEQTMALMRGYGIKLWAVFQDLTQAESIYERRWESFLGNAGVLQSFAPQDVMTAEHLSKRTGQATKTTLSTGDANAVGAAMSVNQIGVPLMLPQDLRNMDEGYSVLFSNKAKGTIRTYAPDPTALGHLKAICALGVS
jgi:type IV secretion system protein VirD4